MKNTDNLRYEYLKEHPLVAFVLFGRKAFGKKPLWNQRTIDGAVDAMRRCLAKNPKRGPKR